VLFHVICIYRVFRPFTTKVSLQKVLWENLHILFILAFFQKLQAHVHKNMFFTDCCWSANDRCFMWELSGVCCVPSCGQTSDRHDPRVPRVGTFQTSHWSILDIRVSYWSRQLSMMTPRKDTVVPLPSCMSADIVNHPDSGKKINRNMIKEQETENFLLLVRLG